MTCRTCGRDIIRRLVGGLVIYKHATPTDDHTATLQTSRDRQETAIPVARPAYRRQPDAPQAQSETVPPVAHAFAPRLTEPSARQTGASGGSRGGAGDGPVSTDPRRVILEEEIELGMT